MTTIRFLHVSDLHLAEQPNLRSLVDRSAAFRQAVRKVLLDDIKHSARKGKLSTAFKGLLEDENIKALRDALHVSRAQINNAIDKALVNIVLGDGSLKRSAAQFLRDQTFASSFDRALYYCLCAFIESEAPNLDAIVITGDLATTGFRKDLDRALSFLEAPLTPSISPVPFQKKLLLPGNHDRFIYSDDGVLYAPGGTLFDQILRRYWSGPVMDYKPLRKGYLSVIVVAADFSLQSKNHCTFPLLRVSRLAQGYVYPDILKAMVARTKQVCAQEEDEGYLPVVFWAVHFPPFFVHANATRASHLLYKLTKNLILEKSLMDAAKKEGIAAILAGHTHEAQDYRPKKYGVRVLCAGSAIADDPGAKQCQIIEVSLDGANQPVVDVIKYEPDLANTTFKI